MYISQKDNKALETAQRKLQCLACDPPRTLRLKRILVRLQTWSLMAFEEGIEILCIKDYVGSSINDFGERISVITNASFAVGC